MVSLSALEIQCFFLAGGICEKKGKWLLVPGATQAITNQKIRISSLKMSPTAKQECPQSF